MYTHIQEKKKKLEILVNLFSMQYTLLVCKNKIILLIFLYIKNIYSKSHKIKNKITVVSLERGNFLEVSWELLFFVESVSIFSSLVSPADSVAFNRKSKGFIY